MINKPQNLEEIKDFSLKIIKEAGDILLKNFNQVRLEYYKGAQDVCTNLDIKVEDFIIKKIQKKYPDHNILSEERAKINGTSNYTWVIDPIDGSKHYLRGLPLFCISLALLQNKDIVFGVVLNPVSGELFFAQNGKGAFLNNKKIEVSQENKIKNSFLCLDVSNFSNFEKYQKQIKKIFENFYRVRILGIGSLSLCYLAKGAFDAYLNIGKAPKIFDIAAALLIVKESGGKISDYNGEKISLDNLKPIVASNNNIQSQILNLIN